MRFSELHNSGCYSHTFLWDRRMRGHGRNVGVGMCLCFVPRRLRMWRCVVSWPQECGVVLFHGHKNVALCCFMATRMWRCVVSWPQECGVVLFHGHKSSYGWIPADTGKGRRRASTLNR